MNSSHNESLTTPRSHHHITTVDRHRSTARDGVAITSRESTIRRQTQLCCEPAVCCLSLALSYMIRGSLLSVSCTGHPSILRFPSAPPLFHIPILTSIHPSAFDRIHIASTISYPRPSRSFRLSGRTGVHWLSSAALFERSPSFERCKPHRRCVVCERVLPPRGAKRVCFRQCLLPRKQGAMGNAICTPCCNAYRRANQTVASAVSFKAGELDAARVKVRVLLTYGLRHSSATHPLGYRSTADVLLLCVLSAEGEQATPACSKTSVSALCIDHLCS